MVYWMLSIKPFKHKCITYGFQETILIVNSWVNATQATFVFRLFRTISVFSLLLIKNHLTYFIGSQNMQSIIIYESQRIVQNDSLANRVTHIFFQNLAMNIGCNLNTPINIFLF